MWRSMIMECNVSGLVRVIAGFRANYMVGPILIATLRLHAVYTVGRNISTYCTQAELYAIIIMLTANGSAKTACSVNGQRWCLCRVHVHRNYKSSAEPINKQTSVGLKRQWANRCSNVYHCSRDKSRLCGIYCKGR